LVGAEGNGGRDVLNVSFVEFDPKRPLGKSFNTGTKRYARSLRSPLMLWAAWTFYRTFALR